MQRDSRALTEFTPNLHITAVQQSYALNDRQTQAGTTRSLGTRRVHTEKTIENPRQSFGRNADACVGNFYADRGNVGVRRQDD